MSIILLIAFVALVLTGEYIIRKRRAHHSATASEKAARANKRFDLNIGEIQVPAGIFVHNRHTWAEVKPNGDITIGLSDFAQRLFRHISGIELLNTGDHISQGGKAFTVTQDSRHADFVAPISGEIIEVNNRITSTPQMIKDDPYQAGWIYKIHPEQLSREIRSLRIGEDARLWLKKEIHRLQEFLITTLNSKQEIQPTMADGGVPVEGIVEQLNDDEWQRLQREFL